jgi:hypothetical protein
MVEERKIQIGQDAVELIEEIKSLRLDENDPDERDAIRGVVSTSRAVLDGMAGAPRRTENDEQLQKQRTDGRRLAKAISENRIDGVDLEILMRYLPRDFLLSFLRLVDSAIGEKSLGSGRGYDEKDMGLGARSRVQTKSEMRDFRGGADKGKKGNGGIPIRSEESLAYLNRCQKRLRNMSREIAKNLSENRSEKANTVTRRRCSGKCKRLGDVEYKFCPNCGGPMQDEIR